MEGMDTEPQTTVTPTASDLIAAFDGDRFIEQVHQAAATQITALIPAPGMIEAAAVRQVLDRHLGPAIEPATGRPLISSLYEVATLLSAAAARDAEALADPRYANAPAVTAKLALQRRVHRLYDETIKVIDVELPAGWLARQERSDLQGTAADGDTTWILEDLELYGTHIGPSDLIIDEDGPTGENLLALWLEATAVGG